MSTSQAAGASTALQSQNSESVQSAQIDQLEKRISDADQARISAEFKSEILQARQDLQDTAYSRLEIEIGLFGLLITILVIAFGFRTEKAAARAAKGELADRQKELDEIITQSRSAADAASRAAKAAETASISADSYAKTAADHAENAKAGADIARAATINSASSSINHIDVKDVENSRNKSAPDRTSEDFRKIILADLENDKWEQIIIVAREMQCSSISSKEDYIFSLFQEAFSLGKLEKTALEISLYDKIIDMYEDSDPLNIKIDVAAAYFNRGLAKSIISGDFTETSDFDLLIERFGQETNDDILHFVAEAHLQRATAFGEMERVNDCISSLRIWSKMRGSFECDEVVGNIFFRQIQHRPTFARFLSEMGCSVTDAP